MKEKTAKELADDHWEYVEKICEMMYKTAMIHGYKHGWEDAKEDTKKY